MLNRRLLMAQTDSGLPIEYTQIEYIQSTATQYINTGVVGGDSASMEILFEPTAQALSWRAFLGASKKPDRMCKLTNRRAGKEIEINWGSGYVQWPYPPGQLLIIVNEGNIFFNGTLVTNQANTSGWGEVPWVVFGCNEERNWGYMKLYTLKMFKDGKLLRHFIPCYKKENGTVGLFDLVTRIFFTNDGTGSFLKGPEVK